MYVLSFLSCVLLFVTLWTAAHQAPLSMGFSRQEYWSGLPCPPPGDLPNPGIEPVSLMSPALAGRFFTTSTTWDALQYCIWAIKFLSSKHKAKCFLFFTYYRHTTLTPRITFRVEVCKDAINSSYLCFDICLLVGGLLLRTFFKTKLLDCNVSSYQITIW